jgi:hypothetical protein
MLSTVESRSVRAVLAALAHERVELDAHDEGDGIVALVWGDMAETIRNCVVPECVDEHSSRTRRQPSQAGT